MATTDVTVMGAGVFGLTTALACARRGATVRVVDPNGPAAGASGGIVGALAPHTPDNWNTKKQFQFECLIAAADYWGALDAESGLSSGYRRGGRLQPLITAREIDLATARVEEAKVLWQGLAAWHVRAATDFGDWAPESPSGQVVFDTLSASIDPAAACQSLVQALRRRGIDIEHVGDPSGAVIWATGYDGLLRLSGETGWRVGSGVKGQAALLDFDAGKAPQIFSDGVHIVPQSGGRVAVGSTKEREFESRDETDGLLEQLLSKARRVIPTLRDARVLKTWANVRPRAATRAPVIGAYPDRPGHFLANGGFTIGFAVAPKLADMTADLVLENRDEVPEAFRVETLLQRAKSSRP